MPPPKTIDKDIGERRITNWTPVGISLCEVRLCSVAMHLCAHFAAERYAALLRAACAHLCGCYTHESQLTHSRSCRKRRVCVCMPHDLAFACCVRRVCTYIFRCLLCWPPYDSVPLT